MMAYINRERERASMKSLCLQGYKKGGRIVGEEPYPPSSVKDRTNFNFKN